MDWKKELIDEFAGLKFHSNEPMAKHSTFRVGGPAELYVEPDIAQAVELIAVLRERGIAYTILGNGSNILVSDEGLEGVVISLAKPAAAFGIAEDGTVVAEAGVLLSQLAAAAAKARLTGLEFAAGIPGSLGGGLVMNAGAYGGELKDVVLTVDVLDAAGQRRNISNAEADFAYRHSRMLDEGMIVLGATLQLAHADQDEIRATMEDLASRRRDKQPLELPSAGSTFKRPEGHFAGKLIQDAGLSGFSVGGAQVSTKHCGFVVNTGGATASDIYSLITQVQQRVQDAFGVQLEPEVRLLGDFK